MSDDGDKPAILKDTRFAVEEGAAYRVFRTGAIWMNKLFFGAVTLLVVWLFMGLLGAAEPACTTSIQPTTLPNGTHADVPVEHCSIWLSTTAIYLGTMAGVSFALSILFGFLGLLVGKRILEMTPRSEEVATKARGGDGTEDDDSPDGTRGVDREE